MRYEKMVRPQNRSKIFLRQFPMFDLGCHEHLDAYLLVSRFDGSVEEVISFGFIDTNSRSWVFIRGIKIVWVKKVQEISINSGGNDRWLNLNTIHFAESGNDVCSTLANLDWKKIEPAKRSALANTCTNTEIS